MSAAYSETVCDAIRGFYGDQRHAAERLARDAGSTPRAARNWLAGENAPGGDALVRLMATCQPVCDAVMRMVDNHKVAARSKIEAKKAALIAELERLDREWIDAGGDEPL